MPQSKPKLSLIQRYTILKGKLQREIERIEKYNEQIMRTGNTFDYIRNKPIQTQFVTVTKDEFEKHINSQIRLHREALELLEDMYNGENDEIV